MNIAHVTTAHPRSDTRVFHKTFSAVSRNYDNSVLLVADGKGNDPSASIIDVCNGRIQKRRILRIYFMAKFLLRHRFSVIHFHDPELIPLMLLLSLRCRVIFDIHEDFISTIPSRTTSAIKRASLIIFLRAFLFLASLRFIFILAEVSYRSKYSSNLRTISVLNLPDTDMLSKYFVAHRILGRRIRLFYVGSITNERGATIMKLIVERLNSLSTSNVYELHIIGDGPDISVFEPSEFFHVYGRLDIQKAFEISRHCHFGLCLLRPLENYLNSIPTKILEYHTVNLPFFVSDFPFYRLLCAKTPGSILVNNEDVSEIASKILYYVTNAFEYEALCAVDHYLPDLSWIEQENRLLALYEWLELEYR